MGKPALPAVSGAARAGEAPAPAEPPKAEPKAEKPANPFGEVKSQRPDAVPGKLVLSDGKEHRGRLYLTRDKKLEVFQDARNEWAKLDLKDLKIVAFKIESEEVAREWRWKTPGSDEKVETGRTKVDRKYLCTAVKADGAKVEGHVRGAPIYVDDGKETRRFMLLWNSPGDFDQKPADPVYVKEVVFGEEAAEDPEKSSLKIIVTPRRILFNEEERDEPKEKPEESKVSLLLVDGGERKMEVIKLVREVTGLGLKEAKDLVDGAPKTLKPGLSRAEALELQKKLEAAGAKAKIEP